MFNGCEEFSLVHGRTCPGPDLGWSVGHLLGAGRSVRPHPLGDGDAGWYDRLVRRGSDQHDRPDRPLQEGVDGGSHAEPTLHAPHGQLRHGDGDQGPEWRAAEGAAPPSSQLSEASKSEDGSAVLVPGIWLHGPTDEYERLLLPQHLEPDSLCLPHLAGSVWCRNRILRPGTLRAGGGDQGAQFR